VAPPRQKTRAAESPPASAPTATDGGRDAPTSQLPVVERELRGWRVTGAGREPVRVRFLDQVEADTGLSLVEAGGTDVRLDPTALGPGSGAGLVEDVVTARATWDQITADLESARVRWRLAARALSESGMNTTRISQLLGISRAAVDKLLRRAAEDPAERVPTATGLDLVDEVGQAQAEVDEVLRRQTEFSSQWAAVALDLLTALRSDRDVAFLLGVSRQRVHQLVQRAQQTLTGHDHETMGEHRG
jgi:predicted transcriptional regulator